MNSNRNRSQNRDIDYRMRRARQAANPQMDSAHEDTLGEDEPEQSNSPRQNIDQVNKIEEEEEETSTLKEKPGLNKSANKTLFDYPEDSQELDQLYKTMKMRATLAAQ